MGHILPAPGISHSPEMCFYAGVSNGYVIIDMTAKTFCFWKVQIHFYGRMGIGVLSTGTHSGHNTLAG